MASQSDFNALFDVPLPDPREMCFRQSKAFVYMRDGDPEHIWSELPDGTVERKRIDTRTVHGALPDERNKQVDLDGLSHSLAYGTGLNRPEPPWMLAVIGANGAGKSTWCQHFAPALPDPFFDPDLIAQKIGSYDDPANQRVAAKMVANSISNCLRERRSFGLESTYSGRSRPRLIETACEKGYAVQALFIGTVSEEINIARVEDRVATQTGHRVPVSEIRRRWTASRDNLVRTAGRFSRIRLLDNSGRGWIEAGEWADGELVREPPSSLAWARNLVDRICGPATRLGSQ